MRVRHIPSASTRWPAAKAATVPGRAPTGLPPRSVTGTMDSAGEAWRTNLLHPMVGREDAVRPHAGPHYFPLRMGPETA